VRHAIAIGCVAAFLLAGCGSDDNPTAPQPSNGVPADFLRLWQTSFVDGTSFFTAIDDSAGQLVTMDVNGVAVAGAFIRTHGRYVNAGTVRVGQSPPLATGVDTLARRSVPVYGTPWYLYTSAPHLPAQPPITFDGVAWHRFVVSGSADFAAFQDSIRSVTRPVISQPAAGAVVPRNEDLIVTWDGGFDPGIRVLCFVRSDVDSNLAAGFEVPDPDGTTRIVVQGLAALPAGPARLSVVRYRERRLTNGGVGIRLKCEGITLRAVTLQ
jgi:hypothetical protein